MEAVSQNARGQRPAPPANEKPPVQEDSTFVIGPEDVLMINVWHEPELTNKVTVRPDGKIGLPLMNEIQAAGLTPKKLQEVITKGLVEFVNSPQVSVIVAEIHSQVVFVSGAVGRAGPYPVGGPMTVMELLIRAGGPTEFAKTQDIQILRKEGTTLKRFKFNYKEFLEGRDDKQNIQLRSGDMVIVP